MAGPIGAPSPPVGRRHPGRPGERGPSPDLSGRGTDPEDTRALVADAPAVTGIVFGVAIIANDNLQDLKTGQLVGATPGKRQVAPVIGVPVGSVIVPPVLNTSSGELRLRGRTRGGPRAWALSRPRA
jgi:hypothetical protein